MIKNNQKLRLDRNLNAIITEKEYEAYDVILEKFNPIEPMLAMEYGKIPNILATKKATYWASKKLDGMRCICSKSLPMSRTWKIFSNEYIQSRFKEMPSDIVFDGELIVGDIIKGKTFASLTDGIRKKTGKPDFKYYIFDIINGEDHCNRYAKLKRVFDKGILPDFCVLVEKTPITTHEQLEELHSKWVEEGYEGVMLNNPDSPYKNGRATKTKKELIKYKKFTEKDAIITGYGALEMNLNESTSDMFGKAKKSQSKDGKVKIDAVGYFMCKDIETGIEFDIGSGLTMKQREDFWKEGEELIGLTIKYKSFEIGSDKKPRMPVFLGIRDDVL